MTLPDIDFARPMPAVSQAEVRRAVVALGLPDGWTPADDVALMEGLFMGLGLQAIGVRLGKPFGETQARFLALRRAAIGHGVFTLDAQTALLNVAREIAGVKP